MIPLLLLLPLAARAATFYVAVNGSDTHDGSRGAPFRTLARGARAANPGDTVIVRDGHYGPEDALTGGDQSDDNHSPVVLRKSGAPQAWITFRSENKWGAILDCEMRCDSYVDLYNAAYVAIEGFVITHGFKEGLHSNDAAHHITLRGNRIEFIANRPSSSPFGRDGIYTNPHCHDFIFDGNVIHDIGRSNPSQLDHGLYLRGSKITVVNNIFYNISHGWAIQAADGLDSLLIAHNVFAFSGPRDKPGQIMLWNRQTNLTVRNNIFYRAEKAALARYQAAISACAIDHNIVYGAPQVVEDAQGCRVESNLMGTDPLFVNASKEPYDFRLRATSPAIGAGTGASVRVDFAGQPRDTDQPDIGAFTAAREDRSSPAAQSGKQRQEK